MNKSKFFVLFLLAAAICLVSFSAVLADQEGNDRWCNSDKYGCWVTGDGGAQSYIVFWSESARELFMGKNSSAPVAPAVPGGKMALTAAPGAPAAPAVPAEQEVETNDNGEQAEGDQAGTGKDGNYGEGGDGDIVEGRSCVIKDENGKCVGYTQS